jgi:hypothetical protein
MITKLTISQPNFWAKIISLGITVFLLAGCSLPLSTPPAPTSVPPSPTPISILPSPTPLVSLATPTPIPATPIPPTQTPLPTVSPTPVPGMIVFTAGTTAGVVEGTAQPGQVIEYKLSASQSQPMILILESPHADVTLGVLEPNGTKLLDPANKWTRWQWLLPKTEVYTIQVIGGPTAEKYTLTAKVAQLVNFASGATSITLNGSTVNGYVVSYGFGCKAGQTMTVSLNVPSTTAYLDVFGIATGPLLSPLAKANSWTGVLPQTQMYVIEVIPNNGQVVNYSLTVTVH